MDEECFKKLASEPKLAIELIMQRHGAQLKKRIAKFVRSDKDLIQDVYQDVLAIIWEDKKRIAIMEYPFAWIMTVAKYKAIDVLKKEIKRKEVAIDEAYSIKDVVQADTAMEYEELYKRFLKAIEQRLTPKEKDVVISAKLHGLDNKQLSALYGVSIQRAKNILSSAIKKMKKYLKD